MAKLRAETLKALNRPRLLTAPAVAKLKAASVRLEIPDTGCPGLRLVIQPSGSKSWAMRFRRPDGKPAKLTLGPLDPTGKEAKEDPKIGDPLTLAAAHALAADIKRQQARGIDVIAQYNTGKERSHADIKESAANTFAPAVRDFIDNYTAGKTDRKPRRWRETARILGLDYPIDGGDPTVIKGGLCERWAEKPIADITEDNIYRVVKEARDEGIPGIERRNTRKSNPRGRRMADALGAMFKWLKAERRIAVNPCIGLDRPKPPAARERVLNVKTDVRNADELRWFWAATSSDKIGVFSAVFRLLLLTGCRLNEIARMTRDELSDDHAMLRLPGSRTKNGLPHDVPLPPLARQILKGVEAVPGGSNLIVFSTTGKTPVSGFSKIKRRLDQLILEEAQKETGRADLRLSEMVPWRIHDLRRTASTGMAGIGVLPHVVEAALNHVSGAKAGVAGTYNVEMYEEEKRAALSRWAAHIEGLVAGRKAKVVPIKRGRK